MIFTLTRIASVKLDITSKQAQFFKQNNSMARTDEIVKSTIPAILLFIGNPIGILEIKVSRKT